MYTFYIISYKLIKNILLLTRPPISYRIYNLVNNECFYEVIAKPKIHGQSIYVKFFFHGSMIYLRHAHRQLVRNIIFVLVYM